MSKHPTLTDTDLDHRLEVALAFSHIAMEALEIPRKRLLAVRAGEPIGPWWPDAQNFVIALNRLRNTIKIMSRDPRVKKSINLKLKKFEAAVPSLTVMRDIGEHLDEQVTRSAKAIKHGVLAESIQIDSFDGHRLTWLGDHSLNIDVAFASAMDLHLEAQRICLDRLGAKTRLVQSETVTGIAPNLTRTIAIGPSKDGESENV
jgi:hypothetical protein